MPKPDLIHVIFNGGTSDESQGLVSLRQRTWLVYAWGSFSGHHANSDAGVVTIGITDSDFKLLLREGDDANSYNELANWDHVVELLNCPAFRLSQQIGEAESGQTELLVVVKGDASQGQVGRLEAVVGERASDVTRIGGNTDVLFHLRNVAEAQNLTAKLEAISFVESVAINPPKE